MNHPHKHTPQSSSPAHSKATAGIDTRPSPLTHPWWIYRANQMKLSNNHAGELLAQIDPFPDEPSSGSEDWR